MKSGKAPGRDNIHPEFVIHQSAKTTAWLCSFFASCFRRSKLPKTWRRATVVALPKPNKPAQDPKSYRPISLLCVPFKILERLIHSRIDPVVDPQLPREQAGFRRGRSTVDQVTLLTQEIEDSFQNNEKAGVVFLDLTAAYDTVWHRGRHLKLLRIIPDRHMVGFIMEMLSNRSFVVHLAILLRRPSWKEMEEGLNNDTNILVVYLRKWRLQLSIGKTVSAAYHLNNREAKRELDVFVDNQRLVFQQAQKYLGVHLDQMLNFKQHLEDVAGNVTSRASLIRRLSGTTWGASAKTLRISTQALVFPAAEYCAPVWSRSPHAKKVDVVINSSLRTISGCLKPTPVFQLPVLAGITPAGLRRKAATLALARKAVKHDWHILNDTTKNEVTPCRLKPVNHTTRRLRRC